MDIARFITMAGLVAGCALMIPVALGAIAELVATMGSQEVRSGARAEPIRVTDPLTFPIRSTGNNGTGNKSVRSPGLRVASLEAARTARSSRDAA